MKQTSNADAGAVKSAELASMTRMFQAACADLGLINEALGLDPNDGGAAPILEAIAELKAQIAAPVAPTAEQAERFVLDDVCNERLRQDAIWGGDAHDDTHDLEDFMLFIVRQRKKAAADAAAAQSIADEQHKYRSRFVKIAALAVAAMASIDRRLAATAQSDAEGKS